MLNHEDVHDLGSESSQAARGGRTSSWFALSLWHVAGLAALGLMSQLMIGRPITRMERDQQLFLMALAAAFGIAAAVNVWWVRRRAERWRLTRVPMLVFAAFGAAALGLILLQAPYVSRTLLIGAMALTTAVLLLAGWIRNSWLVAGSVALLAGGIGLQAMDLSPGLGRRARRNEPKPAHTVAVVETRYGSISASYYDNYFPICDASGASCDYTPRTGGGVDGLADGYLVATGEGVLHYVTRDAQGSLKVAKLPYRVPLNDADFLAAGAPEFVLNVFRVNDVLVEEHAGQATLYATHHFYDKAGDCLVMRLSAMRGPATGMASGTVPAQWHTLYQTKPCIPRSFGPTVFVPHGDPHPLQQSGGRLARLDASSLLMTVGDHNLDGVNNEAIAPQDLASDYGKTLAIDLESGTSTVFTFGHRNPQGLHVTKDGTIWSTEHGPQGGDELNRLVRGTNYGWPFATYGTQYGPERRRWPVSLTANEHRGFEEPVYSWVPSIAVTNVIAVCSDKFPFWQGDLLIGSFRESLFRARIRSGRVVTLEPVPLRVWRGRIRDLYEDRHGTIVVWFDDGVIAFLDAAAADAATTVQTNAPRNQALFNACAGCHAVADGSTHGIGPDLAGIVNRPIASREGFAYSPALSRLSRRWTEESLDQFLKDPQAFAPGNTMLFSGLPDAADRAALIAYLKNPKSSTPR